MKTPNTVLEVIKQIINHNTLQLNLVEGDQGKAEDLHTFEFEGVAVFNPMYDTTLRFEVDPFEYYGEENILNFVQRFNEKVE